MVGLAKPTKHYFIGLGHNTPITPSIGHEFRSPLALFYRKVSTGNSGLIIY
jgi:hypothetical protein